MRYKTVETFPYFGAKSLVGAELARYYPQSGISTVVDCCGGSGKLAVNMPVFYSKIVYNDLDPLLCNLFSVLKDSEFFSQFCELAIETGYSEESYNKANEMCEEYKDGKGITTDEIAVALAVAKYQRICLSFNSMQKNFRKETVREHKIYASRLLNLYEVHKRLNELDILVTNEDALEIIKRANEENRTDMFLILDVPYVAGENEERKQLGGYGEFDWEKDLHEKFLNAVKDSPCPILICGYRSELYTEMLNPVQGIPTEQGQWGEITVAKVSKGSGRVSKGKKKSTADEIIWINYPI